MQLYPYQSDFLPVLFQSLVKNKRVIALGCTGCGKTVIFSKIANMAISKGKQVLILVDRVELKDQAKEKLNTNLQIIDAKTATIDPKAALTVAMVETLYKRKEKPLYAELLSRCNLVIIDEAHMACFDKMFAYFAPSAFVVGFTATPKREANQAPLKDYYNAIEIIAEPQNLIDIGRLAKPKYYGVKNLILNEEGTAEFKPEYLERIYEEKHLYTGVVSNHRRLSHNKKTLVFCTSVAASLKVCGEFQQAGYPAKHIDSDNCTPEQRKAVIKWLADTPNGILCNVGILVKGFDMPSIRNIIVFLATKSLVKWIQIVGRGGRVENGKTDFTVQDYGNNVNRHGAWEEERVWSLEPPKKKLKGAPPRKLCPECDLMLPTTAKICPECKHEFKTKPKTAIEVELEEIQVLKEKVRAMTQREAYATFNNADIKIKALMIHSGFPSILWHFHRCDYEEAKAIAAELCRLSGGVKWKYFNEWLERNAANYPNLKNLKNVR